MAGNLEALLPHCHLFPKEVLLAAAGRPGPFVLLETTRPSAEDVSSYLFTDPIGTVTTSDPEKLEGCLAEIDEGLARGLWAAGYVSYEAGCVLEPSLRHLHRGEAPLLWFGLFNSPYRFDHIAGTFSPPLPPDLSPARRASPPTKAEGEPEFLVGKGSLSLSPDEYRLAFDTIQEMLGQGETYQINFTMKYRFDFSGSAAGLYFSLRDNQPVPYAAYLRTDREGEEILSASPELFLRCKGLDVTVRPMKGTMARGRDAKEDRNRREELARDVKNRAENIMIVDLVRNDLGRICLPGSIVVDDLFSVEAYDTLLQMTSTVRGRLRKNEPMSRILKALFPCGSVTGAPKIRSMEIINSLEENPRGVYCGGVGFFSPHGEAVLSVPIRTIVLEEDRGEMGVGSGIVADSNAAAEYEECLLKSRFLTRPLPPLRLIETLLWERNGGYFLLEDHLERLAESARHFSVPFSLERTRNSLAAAAADLSAGAKHRVRLVAERDGRCSIESAPLPPDNGPPKRRAVCLSTTAVDSSNPFLYHKTSRRNLYDTALAEARREGYFEVIFTNERGEVTEGSFTNIFIEKDGLMSTPPVSAGLLPGILRRHLLREKSEGVTERTIRPRELEEADRLFVGNSVRGLVEVSLAAREKGAGPGRGKDLQ